MTIYTDGASSKKNNLGAFGIYVAETGYTLVKTVEGVTNNFSELAAFICALKHALNASQLAGSKDHIVIVSDSLYVLDGYTQYMDTWDLTSRLNGDLWKIIHDLKHKNGAVFTTRHCRGHGKGKDDHPDDVKGNDVIDKLVAKAVQP